jgi:NADH:ubiquinone reductase (non-electrogenic)
MAMSSKALTRFGAAASRLSAAEAVAVAKFGRSSASFATKSCASKRPILAPLAVITNAVQPLSRQFARTYVDAALIPKKKAGKIRTTFKWLWRATYLSLIIGVGAVIYDGYTDRHPDEQFIPDPEKKTLVILGEF